LKQRNLTKVSFAYFGVKRVRQGSRILMLKVQSRDGAVSFSVRVQPRASKNEVVGVLDGTLKIRLRAPAVENRANEALCEFLADLLKRPKSAVRILGGERSRAKRVEILGVTVAEVVALTLYDA
jgi:uncharacterized protein